MKQKITTDQLERDIVLEVTPDWEAEELSDRVRWTHKEGMRLELCLTDLPEWPPSAVREKFTAAYKDQPMQVYNSNVKLRADGVNLYVLLYLPAGKTAPADEVIDALLASIKFAD